MSTVFFGITLPLAIVLIGLFISLALFAKFLFPWKTWKRWPSFLFSLWYFCSSDPAGRTLSFIEILATRMLSYIWGDGKNILRLLILSLSFVILCYIIIFSSLYIGTYRPELLSNTSFTELEIAYHEERERAISEPVAIDLFVNREDHRITYARLAAERFGTYEEFEYEYYYSVIQYKEEMEQILYEVFYPVDFIELVDRKFRSEFYSFTLMGAVFFLPLVLSIFFSVICTTYIIGFHLRMARKIKGFTLTIFVSSLSVDAIIATMSTVVIVSISVFLVPIFADILRFIFPAVYVEAVFRFDMFSIYGELLNNLASFEPIYADDPELRDRQYLIFQAYRELNPTQEMPDPRQTEYESISRYFATFLFFDSETVYSRPDIVIISHFSEFLNDMYAIIGSGNFELGAEPTFRNWMFVLALLPLCVHALCGVICLIVWTLGKPVQASVAYVATRLEAERISPIGLMLGVLSILVAIFAVLDRV